MSLINNLIVFFKGLCKGDFNFSYVSLVLFVLLSICGSAQEEEKEAQHSLSNNYVFEGNSLVNENFIEAEKKIPFSSVPDQFPLPGCTTISSVLFTIIKSSSS